MSLSRLESLLNRYVENSCSPQEEKELMGLLADSKNEDQVQKLLDKVVETTGAETSMNEHVAASILQKILEKDNGKAKIIPIKSKHAIWFSWMRVAAVVLLFVSGITYWTLERKNNDQALSPATVPAVLPVIPGGNHAVLIMANGSKILLDSVQNTNVQVGDAKINKRKGVVVFSASQSDSVHSAVSYNTLSTPRGGKYQLILPDGSKVWLNASSSLRFPTVFAGNQREVTLTGEAYFEVAKNKMKPFHVIVADMEVKVLGTHFNINAYDNEDAVKTSLLEGSVEITKGRTSGFLKPGQQSVLDKKNDQMIIREVDMDRVIAWKNDLFEFNSNDIKEIMREISRWYDVDIEYEGKVPTGHFSGIVSRNNDISQVLKIMQAGGVKFRMEGRKIVVLS